MIAALLLMPGAFAQKPMTDQQRAAKAVKKYRISSLLPIDGSQNPKLSASRLQIALVAFMAASKLIDLTDSLDQEISSITGLVDELANMSRENKRPRPPELRVRVDRLKVTVSKMKDYPDDIEWLKGAVSNYATEFRILGIDPKGIESKLLDLGKRVATH